MLFYLNVDELTMLNDAISASDMAWWIMEFPSGVVFFHPNKIRILGYSDSDAENFAHYTSFTNRIHKDDYKEAMQNMRDHLEGKKDRYETAYRVKTKDGTYRRFFDRGRVVARDNHGNIALAGIVIYMPEDEATLKEVLQPIKSKTKKVPRSHSHPKG